MRRFRHPHYANQLLRALFYLAWKGRVVSPDFHLDCASFETYESPDFQERTHVA